MQQGSICALKRSEEGTVSHMAQACELREHNRLGLFIKVVKYQEEIWGKLDRVTIHQRCEIQKWKSLLNSTVNIYSKWGLFYELSSQKCGFRKVKWDYRHKSGSHPRSISFYGEWQNIEAIRWKEETKIKHKGCNKKRVHWWLRTVSYIGGNLWGHGGQGTIWDGTFKQ